MDRCFAYDEKGCKALRIRKCGDCNFYKTREEADEGRKRTIERIKTLDKEKKDYINETYYGGRLGV